MSSTPAREAQSNTQRAADGEEEGSCALHCCLDHKKHIHVGERPRRRTGARVRRKFGGSWRVLIRQRHHFAATAVSDRERSTVDRSCWSGEH